MNRLIRKVCTKCKAIKECIDVFELHELEPFSGSGTLHLYCITCNTEIAKFKFIKE